MNTHSPLKELSQLLACHSEVQMHHIHKMRNEAIDDLAKIGYKLRLRIGFSLQNIEPSNTKVQIPSEMG